jgi:hypothetical protein
MMAAAGWFADGRRPDLRKIATAANERIALITARSVLW